MRVLLKLERKPLNLILQRITDMERMISKEKIKKFIRYGQLRGVKHIGGGSLEKFKSKNISCIVSPTYQSSVFKEQEPQSTKGIDQPFIVYRPKIRCMKPPDNDIFNTGIQQAKTKKEENKISKSFYETVVEKKDYQYAKNKWYLENDSKIFFEAELPQIRELEEKLIKSRLERIRKLKETKNQEIREKENAERIKEKENAERLKEKSTVHQIEKVEREKENAVPFKIEKPLQMKKYLYNNQEEQIRQIEPDSNQRIYNTREDSMSKRLQANKQSVKSTYKLNSIREENNYYNQLTYKVYNKREEEFGEQKNLKKVDFNNNLRNDLYILRIIGLGKDINKKEIIKVVQLHGFSVNSFGRVKSQQFQQYKLKLQRQKQHGQMQGILTYLKSKNIQILNN